MSKFGAYILLTVLVTVAAVHNAVQHRKQFYSATIYLTTNKINILVMGNLAFSMLVLLGKLVKFVFLGQLSREELEHLVQNSKFSITEICLALTIFRGELTLQVLFLSTVLLFVKIFHWMSAMRVENLARSEIIPWSTHFRIQGLLALLGILDASFFVSIGLHLLKTKQPSVLLLFGFEYLILTVAAIATFLRYVLLVIDVRMQGRWLNKSHYVFYLEFASSLCRLFLYLLFFMIICTFYGMPLHLIRELYITFFSLRERVVKFIQYRKITRNMQERFPDATVQELEEGDRTCIVCREDMMTAKKLPCGHCFHFHCLRTWMEQRQSCPMCRRIIPLSPTRPPVLPANLQAVVDAANANARANAAAQDANRQLPTPLPSSSPARIAAASEQGQAAAATQSPGSVSAPASSRATPSSEEYLATPVTSTRRANSEEAKTEVKSETTFSSSLSASLPKRLPTTLPFSDYIKNTSQSQAFKSNSAMLHQQHWQEALVRRLESTRKAATTPSPFATSPMSVFSPIRSMRNLSSSPPASYPLVGSSSTNPLTPQQRHLQNVQVKLHISMLEKQLEYAKEMARLQAEADDNLTKFAETWTLDPDAKPSK